MLTIKINDVEYTFILGRPVKFEKFSLILKLYNNKYYLNVYEDYCLVQTWGSLSLFQLKNKIVDVFKSYGDLSIKVWVY